MDAYKLGEMEQRFADLIWANAPVPSGELVKLCGQAFGWKRSTTYTMLKRLCGRGIFANNGGTVTALMEKSDFHAAQGEELIRESFGGSLPQFLTAFTRRHRLDEQEIEALRRLIDEHKEE